MESACYPDAAYLIEHYGMKPHPEGGYFVETFRSDVSVELTTETSTTVTRPASTAILFLLTPGNVSRLHKIKSDEVWHFYIGGSITVVEIFPDGPKLTVIGPNVRNGDLLQYTVKANTWFGSYLNSGYDYSLVGCTVAPGFVFEDFELASRSKLLSQYSNSDSIIVKLTEGLP